MVCKVCGSEVDNAGEELYYCPACMKMLGPQEVMASSTGGRRYQHTTEAPLDAGTQRKIETALLVGMIIMIIIAVLAPCGNFLAAIPAAAVATILFEGVKKCPTPFAKKIRVVVIICLLFTVLVMLAPILLCVFSPFM